MKRILLSSSKHGLKRKLCSSHSVRCFSVSEKLYEQAQPASAKEGGAPVSNPNTNNTTTKQQKLRKEDKYNLSGIKLLDDDGFATIIPQANAKNVDFTKMTPEEAQKVRQDLQKKRLEKGFEYNPFDAARMKAQGKPIIDKKEALQMQEDFKENIEHHRAKLEDYIKTKGDQMPANMRRLIKLVIALDKNLENGVTTSLAETQKMIEEETKQMQAEAIAQGEPIPALGETTEFAGTPELNVKVKPQEVDPDSMLGLHLTNAKKEEGPGFWGYFVATLAAGSVMLGLSWPGFKRYILEPMMESLTGEKPDKERID